MSLLNKNEENLSAGNSGDAKEWKLIEKLVLSMQNEQRSTRRWGIIFKGLFFVYLFVLLAVALSGKISGGGVADEHTALIEINGPIMADGPASADMIVTALRNAFEAEEAKAIILRINSPGGSPVQSGYIYDEIDRLQAEYADKKVYAVIVDIGASGAYYIAAAADEIYADKASIVGSIGVIMGGFGFEKAIEKLGVERRVMTAGTNKALMDPFSPVDPEQRAHLQAMLDTIHKQFIDSVKAGRGDKLSDSPDIFSGLFWTGEEAVGLGLVDAIGSSSYVAREVVGAKDIVDYTVRPRAFEEFAKKFGVSVGEGLANVLSLESFNIR